MIGTYAHPSTDRGNICPTDYEEVAVDGTVATLTLAKASGKDYALVRSIGGPFRITLHGVDPTATFGVPIFDTDNFILVPREMLRLRAIVGTGGSPGTLCVIYYQHNVPPP